MNWNEKEDYHSLKALRSRFAGLTKNFDLEDWRTVRTSYYWESDRMSPVNAIAHKIKLIEYYINKGIPLK
jgi:hypothetical protein